jgi:hypothetical protein
LSNPYPSGAASTGTSDHEDPFHWSENAPACVYPTAKQKSLVAQDTDVSVAGWFGTGIITLLHDEPFHSSDGSSVDGGTVE